MAAELSALSSAPVSQPVLHLERGHTRELGGIRRDQRQFLRPCLRRDQQVIGTDGQALSGELVTDLGVMPVCRRLAGRLQRPVTIEEMDEAIARAASESAAE